MVPRRPQTPKFWRVTGLRSQKRSQRTARCGQLEVYGRVMAKAGHDDPAAVARSAAAIVSRLDQRMAELSGSIQQIVVDEIAELRDDAQLLQLLRDSIDGNIATVFSAIRHAIPIEKVELPTAARRTRTAPGAAWNDGQCVGAFLPPRTQGGPRRGAGRDSGVGLGAAAEPRRVQSDLRSHVRLRRLDHSTGGDHLSKRA